MKKKMIIFLSILILIILMGNFSPLRTFLVGLPVYNYTTETGKFKASEIPWKGKNFDDTIISFENFRKGNSSTSDTVLYRSFKIQPLKFWNWYEYLTHERYELPYKEVLN